MSTATIAEIVPDAGVHLTCEFSAEVGNRLPVWFYMACPYDMLLNVAHLMHQRIE